MDPFGCELQHTGFTGKIKLFNLLGPKNCEELSQPNIQTVRIVDISNDMLIIYTSFIV